jgi:hypothetical protein
MELMKTFDARDWMFLGFLALSFIGTVGGIIVTTRSLARDARERRSLGADTARNGDSFC